MNTPKKAGRSRKAGLAPGTLIHVGSPKAGPGRISHYSYSREGFEEKRNCSIDDLQSLSENKTHWIDVDGIHDIELIQKIGDRFKIHPLTLEDIVNTSQRPKRDEFEDSAYFVIKMIRLENQRDIIMEQVSIVLTKNVVLTFQEGTKDVFDPIRGRLRSGNLRPDGERADFLVYSCIDAIVDHYFIALESLGESLEALEKELVQKPNQRTLPKIYASKRSILHMRRSIWPLREVLNSVIRGESRSIGPTALLYFRDVYDHTIEILDIIENAREITSSMIDVYLSSVSNRVNEIMRVLTVITTIFMPLSFIAGVYGMNFVYMPELQSPYGYPAVLLAMAMVVIGMLVFFRKRDWL